MGLCIVVSPKSKRWVLGRLPGKVGQLEGMHRSDSGEWYSVERSSAAVRAWDQ